ncbi:sensor histidine kinase [Brevibacillus humidisoli]|uniref:sensor histidine kinase n=1 Tax=Brevibacillus humidisoli TaxID=2895522 RepID=UPI001E45C62D|nr:sensor histidine kinase [Brevibacillus humidisoli]UFJ43007.1 sensor histidine kinase [Brevibacillus humidisoli]
MRLFIRDQLWFLLLFVFQLTLLLLIFWLDGYWNPWVVAYAGFLCLFFAAVYLLIRYLTHRLIYQRLSTPVDALEEVMQPLGNAPLARALDESYQRHYRLYSEQLHRYEQKQREHNTFIQQWVHQMKTPLSVIQLLLQDQDDSQSDSVREELDRLKRGLETVLYLSRLDRFDRDFVIEPVSLRSLVQQVLSENKRLFIRNEVYPELRVDAQWLVASDEKWLSFVLNQLITNAVRYSAGKSRKVSFVAYRRGTSVALEVIDYGIGIPKQDLQRVFQPYFTGENGRKYTESTGMGLYLVREICSRLDHAVELESEPGKGTIVRILFTTEIPTLQ